jgi:hypothetical protein
MQKRASSSSFEPSESSASDAGAWEDRSGAGELPATGVPAWDDRLTCDFATVLSAGVLEAREEGVADLRTLGVPPTLEVSASSLRFFAAGFFAAVPFLFAAAVDLGAGRFFDAVGFNVSAAGVAVSRLLARSPKSFFLSTSTAFRVSVSIGPSALELFSSV